MGACQARLDPYIPTKTSVPAIHGDKDGRAWIEHQKLRAATRPGVVLASYALFSWRYIGHLRPALQRSLDVVPTPLQHEEGV